MANIVGVDLNVDQDYLEQAVRQTVLMGISEALNGKNEIVSQIVHEVLRTRVDRSGVPASDYEIRNGNTQTLLEYYVRGLITEEVREQLKAIVEEHREDIRASIHEELEKQSTADKFTRTFIGSVSKALESYYWSTTINVSFKGEED